jgi:hypothetical protein
VYITKNIPPPPFHDGGLSVSAFYRENMGKREREKGKKKNISRKMREQSKLKELNNANGKK